MNREAYSLNDEFQFRTCAGVARGDIWSVKINREDGEDLGTFVVVSPESENMTKPYVIMVSTSEILRGRPRPSRFPITVSGEERFVICETIKKVDGERLVNYLGKLTPEETEQLDDALRYTLGLSKPKKDFEDEEYNAGYKELYDNLIIRYGKLLDEVRNRKEV